MEDDTQPPRGFTDRRARLLHAHALITAGTAAMFTLLVVSYRSMAPELGRYGWMVVSIVAGLVTIAAACLGTAFWVQAATNRRNDNLDQVDAAFADGPVEIGLAPVVPPALPPAPPAEPAPAPAPVHPVPVPQAPAAVAEVAEPVAPAAPVGGWRHPLEDTDPADVTEPAHH